MKQVQVVSAKRLRQVNWRMDIYDATQYFGWPSIGLMLCHNKATLPVEHANGPLVSLAGSVGANEMHECECGLSIIELYYSARRLEPSGRAKP